MTCMDQRGPADYPALCGEVTTDVAIVGGGLTGITAALLLSSCGIRTALVEKRTLGSGASWGCLGQLAIPGREVTDRIRRTAGDRLAALYDRHSRESLSGITDAIARFCISADLTLCPDGRMTLSPMDYLTGMAETAGAMGCRIFEYSPVRRIAPGLAVSDQGTLHADWILLATGTPLNCHRMAVLSLLDPHVFEMRELSGPWASFMPTDAPPDCLQLRPWENGLLVRCDLGPAGSPHLPQRQALARDLRAHFPAMTTIDGCFRQDILSRDGLPMIGPLIPGGRILAATGYSGYGLAGSFLAARVLTGIILGQPLPDAGQYAPDRRYRGLWRTRLRGGLSIAGRFLSGLSDLGAPKCPHMGCRLIYCPTTRRWECPCHGSSFGPHGELVTAPASCRAAIPCKRRIEGE